MSATTGHTPADPTGLGTPPTRRLPNGELRRQVTVYLHEAPHDTFTPGAIARALSRSSGAVANALTVLASHGEAELVAERPARYRATPATGRLASIPPGVRVTPRAPKRSVRRTAGPAAPSTAPSSAPPSAPGPGIASVPDPADAPVSGPVARPNGQLYHPRTVAGMPDVTVLRKLRAAGVPALLYGPPGTGKTSVVEAAFGDLITCPGTGTPRWPTSLRSTPRPRRAATCSCTARSSG